MALAGCGGGDSTFKREFAADFTPQHHVISVFGVYKDGQMSTGAWDTLAPRIARALGGTRCDAGYTDALAVSHADLSSAIDDYARADGPTDDLLTQVAPAAAGDLILVLTFAGVLPVHTSGGPAPDAPAPSMGGGGRGGGRGGGGMRAGKGSSFAPASTDELDLSASLFSVAHSQSVAVVSLRYIGTSVDDAVTKLAAKLGESLPGATCTGWNWDAKVDPERIRHAIDP